VWNGTVIAESEDTVVVEGNHYFPPESVRWEHLQPSERATICPWKGRADCFTVLVDERRQRDAAWQYPCPTPAAEHIAGHVAFWRSVGIESSGPATADLPTVGRFRRLRLGGLR